MKKALLILFFASTFISGGCTNVKPVVVTISNPIKIDRVDEIAEISMKDVSKKLQLDNKSQLIIIDENNKEIPYQITYNDKLIFPVSVKARGKVKYYISIGTPTVVETVACGRQYPERLDDMAWENDKAAYRAYGPALQKRGERAFGYDVWTKSTSHPVVEERYDGDINKKISYHVDHGNGLDCYSVGPTLGGGTAALFPDSTIIYPYCYNDYEILDNGPLRFSVKLVYNPITMKEDTNIVETRIISLDKGSHLNKTEVTYANLTKITPVITGIVVHKEHPDGHSINLEKRYISYADSTDNPRNNNGVIYIGAVLPSKIEGATIQLFPESMRKERGGALGHVISVSKYIPGDKYTYYWGSGWSKCGFATENEWNKYLGEYSSRLDNPLNIDMK